MDPEVTGTTTGYDDLASSIGAAMASSSTTPSLIRASSGVGSEELMASRSVSGGGSGADMRIVHSNIMIGTSNPSSLAFILFSFRFLFRRISIHLCFDVVLFFKNCSLCYCYYCHAGSLPDDFDLWEDTTFMSTNTKTTTRL